MTAVRLAIAALFTTTASAAADPPTIHAPVGGAPFPLPNQRVLCGRAPDGWQVLPNRNRIRPPTKRSAIGRDVPIQIAPSKEACEQSSQSVVIRATERWPTIDRNSVRLHVDAGRLSVRGRYLGGAMLAWRIGSASGTASCASTNEEGGLESCSFAVHGDPSVSARGKQFTVFPRGARTAEGSRFFDVAGRPVDPADRTVEPSRYVVHDVAAVDQPLDLSSGQATLPIRHARAITEARCQHATCTMDGNHLRVRRLTKSISSLTVELTLAPNVVVQTDDGFDDTVTYDLPLALCPLRIVSGFPLRYVDDTRVVVQLPSRCGGSARSLRWSANGIPAEVEQIEEGAETVYVVLGVGHVAAQSLSIRASRPDAGASVVGLTNKDTQRAPRIRTVLALPGYGDIDFIPRNRTARLRLEPPPPGVSLVPLPLPGAYTISTDSGIHTVRGIAGAGGFIALRFGYRMRSLPPKLRALDIAVLSDVVQRPIREARVPAPIAASVGGKKPITELRCGTGDDDKTIPPGTEVHLPWRKRNSCRLILHRNRIDESYGEQRLDVQIEVQSRGGETRPESKLGQQLVLRHGTEPRVIWIRGVKAQFDRISVHTTHVIDESQYLRSPKERVEMPSAQWSVVTEDADFRFYATATIPTNLYRFSNDPESLGTGPLALNFGVLSRVTWLNRDGSDGILGLELGAMGMGIASDKDRQLNVVGGLGVSVPLGNAGKATQAALGVHAWAGYRLGSQTGELENGDTVDLSPWSFIFGPSVSIGSVGVNL